MMRGRFQCKWMAKDVRALPASELVFFLRWPLMRAAACTFPNDEVQAAALVARW